MEKGLQELIEGTKKFERIANGFYEFQNFSDAMVFTSTDFWPAHEYVLSTRIEMNSEEKIELV